VGPLDVLKSTVTISAPLNGVGTRIVTVKALDSNSNPIAGYQFNLEIIITNNDNTRAEMYGVQEILQGSKTKPITEVTNAQGEVGFDITFFTAIDSGDGISVQVKTIDNQNIGLPFSYINP